MRAIPLSFIPLMIAASGFLGGCLMKDVQRDPRPPITLPEAFAGDGSEAADPGRWWLSFGNAELEQLVSRALTHNFQLKQAWARLEQAEALAKGAGSSLQPRVDAQISAGRSKTAPSTFNIGGQEQQVPGREVNSFQASVPVSYEVDVWGRIRAGMFAAEEDVDAFRADVETAAITIAANVTERWFDILEQRALRKLIDSQIEINQLNLELVVLRFGENDAGLSDIYQQRNQIQVLRAQRVGVVTAEQLAEKQLALLLGAPPAKLIDENANVLPAPPPLPQAGIPASMLERRPDLRAAKSRVVAADYRVARRDRGAPSISHAQRQLRLQLDVLERLLRVVRMEHRRPGRRQHLGRRPPASGNRS